MVGPLFKSSMYGDMSGNLWNLNEMVGLDVGCPYSTCRILRREIPPLHGDGRGSQYSLHTCCKLHTAGQFLVLVVLCA